MTVHIKKSKTDPFRQTSTITIASSRSNVCAMAATRDFLLQTPDSFPQSPMFQFKDGTPSHDVPWPRTYTPYLSCAAFNLITTTLTASELGLPRQQLPLAYPRGLSRFLAAGALTPMKGTFTSLKLPSCKSRLLWLPTTKTTLELRT